MECWLAKGMTYAWKENIPESLGKGGLHTDDGVCRARRGYIDDNTCSPPASRHALEYANRAEGAQLALWTNACLKPTTGVVVETDLEEGRPAMIIGNVSVSNGATLLAVKDRKANRRDP